MHCAKKPNCGTVKIKKDKIFKKSQIHTLFKFGIL